MAVYFLQMKTFGRANGSSAVSAIAYRAGERIRDERTGKVYDHTGRHGVMHTEIVLPQQLNEADMSWAKDRNRLWNAVEAAETRKNSRVAREFLVALPAELDADRRLNLVRGFSQDLADRYRFAVDFAIHAPRTDPRNFHAHLLATTREIGSDGFGAKTTLELNDAARINRGLQPFVQELIATRERWATSTNEALREANVAARVDHRTLAAQGIDREPRLQLPRAVYEMERRGEYNAVAERMRREHEARVRQRVQSAAAKFVAPQPRPAAPMQSIDEIRRQARENWLRLRETQRNPAAAQLAQAQRAQAERTQAQRSQAARESEHAVDDDFAQ
jgi:ATP-dependent exoDNAse (exonuclease V) alpha subunit